MITKMCPVFGLAMVATCLGCYSNWFLKRVDGYLWRWKPSSLSIFAICRTHHIVNSHLVFYQWVSTALINTMLRCCFWSPIILLVCVARQVNLSLAQIWSKKTYFVSYEVAKQMFSQVKSELCYPKSDLRKHIFHPTRWPKASCQEWLVRHLRPVKL